MSHVQAHDQQTGEHDPLLRDGMHIHLVGIGGSGLSAIAWHLLGRGFTVSGSDLRGSDVVSALAQEGARITIGHAAENVSGAELVVISSAVPSDNEEVAAARAAGLRVLKRADLLGELMRGAAGIAVAGTHGKTTTTSMIAHVLLESDRDPSVIVGGTPSRLEKNGRAGKGEHFVVEADEYDYMFLGLHPRIAVVTNLEHDHPDLFPTAAEYHEAFHQFVGGIEEGGLLVACHDDAGARQLLAAVTRADVRHVTYGIDGDLSTVDYGAVDLRPNQLGGSDFVVTHNGDGLGVVRLRVPGEHNVRNALAAIAVCEAAGVSFANIMTALASFGGVGRRFQVVGEVNDVTVIDDYAHHPTEIRVTLAAARQRYPGRRLWAVWQPHTYSRTRLLKEAFAQCFDNADRVVVLDVYRSRETDTLGVNSQQIVSAMEHDGAVHIGERADAAEHILQRVRPGDVILTLGAGDGNEVGVWIFEGLQRRVRGNP